MLFGEIKVKVDYLRTVDKITCVRPARYLAFFHLHFSRLWENTHAALFYLPRLNSCGVVGVGSLVWSVGRRLETSTALFIASHQ